MPKKELIGQEESSFKGIIGRLLHATGLSTQASLASYLGISPSKIADASRRGHVPALWIYKVAYETGCRLEWLQRGEEPKTIAERHAAVSQKWVTLELAFPGLLQAWHDLGEEGRNVMSDYFSFWIRDEEIRNYLALQRTILKRAKPHRRHRPQKLQR